MISTQSIGSKIFGLAVLLLLLTVALAVFLLLEAAQTRRETEVLVRFDQPLVRSVEQINEFGLRRRLAFERWFGALNAARPNPEAIAEASTDFTHFTARIQAESATALALLDSFPSSRRQPPELAEVRLLLQLIASAYGTISTRQEELLRLQRAGEHLKADELLGGVADLMRQVQEQRSLAQQKMTAFSAAAGQAIARHQQRVQTLAIAATISTVLLGLLLAAVITRRLTRPVRSLIRALRTVQGGDLEVQLPVESADEVGALTDSFNYFIRELRTKERIKQMFGKYIDPRVVEQVLLQPGTAGTAGERRVMTVLFADLVGFTALCERLTPAFIVAVVNRHFGLQAQTIQAHQGVVDKFIGDSVMAFWGPPFAPQASQASLACRAALAQLAVLETLRRELPELIGQRQGAPRVDLRIGLATGEVVVGNIGSENTRSFTVIGDTVNLASRLESLNRLYGTCILLSEGTARAVAQEFELRELDAVAVKGKSEPTLVFELLGPAGSLPADQARLRQLYAEGLAAYRAQDWDAAESRFRQCLEARPGDGPSRTLLDRLPALRRTPPPQDWDTVFVATQK